MRADIRAFAARQGLSILAGWIAFSPSCLGAAPNAFSITPEFSGQMNLEYRQFFQTGAAGQDTSQPSIVLQPEFYWSFNDRHSSVNLIPFYRYDAMDGERTHFDIREFKYLTYWQDYELRVGINKVFWGVTEAEHLVDQINQTDAIEAVDGEDKLGQPMVQFSILKDWGTTELFWLPYFRERTFAGQDGRLRTTIPVETDKAIYQSSAKQYHQDFALRYSTTMGNWDVGLSYLQGTDREPVLILNGNSLIPYYSQMHSAGLDVQGTTGSWLWKLEARYKDSLQTYTATDSGFEYTLVGIGDTSYDLGILSEYLYDSRGLNSQAIGQNDLFAAVRLSFNDQDSSQILLGMAQDLDNPDVRWFKLETSTRLTSAISLNIDGWASDNHTPTDALYSIRQDDFIQLTLAYYF